VSDARGNGSGHGKAVQVLEFLAEQAQLGLGLLEGAEGLPEGFVAVVGRHEGEALGGGGDWTQIGIGQGGGQLKAGAWERRKG